MALSQTSWSQTILNLIPLQPVNLNSQDVMNVVGGATIELRTRINRPDDEFTMALAFGLQGAGAVAEVVGIEGGVISALFQQSKSALARRGRLRHEERYHENAGRCG